MAVAIKRRTLNQKPPDAKSWARRRACVNVVIEIPNRCLMRAGILKHIVRVAVAVKVTYCYTRAARATSASAMRSGRIFAFLKRVSRFIVLPFLSVRL